MGNFQSNTVISNQKVENNILQNSRATCNATCTNNVNGNSFYLKGSTIGSLKVDEVCAVNLNCTIQQTVNNQVTNILAAIAKQKADTTIPVFSANFSNQKNFVDFEQRIANNIAQNVVSTCNAKSENNFNNNIVYLENSKATDIVISQNANVVSMCNLSNTVTNQVYNEEKTKADQTIKAVSSLVALILGIVIILGVTGMGKSMNGKKPNKGKMLKNNKAVLKAMGK